MAKKRTTKKPAAKSAGATTINRSAVVRDYYQKHPEAKPKQVSAAIQDELGVFIKPQMVSTIRNQAIKSGKLVVPGSKVEAVRPAKKRGRPAGKKTVARAIENGDAFTAKQLIQAKTLVKELGGVEQAKQALSVLDKILD